MTSDLERVHYSKSLNALGIPRDKDPFPFDAPREVDYWADNKKVLQKVLQAQIDSIMFASSFIYVFYGPFGGGKTFAVAYLANPKTQKIILESSPKPKFESLIIRVAAVAPLRTGQLTFSLHKDIVKKCFSTILRSQELMRIFGETRQLGSGKIGAAFEDIRKSVTPSLEGKLKIVDLAKTEAYKLLTQTRSRLGKLEDVNELVETVRILVNILTKKYGRVIISVDELENLARATGTERVLCSDFLRKMHEMIEHDLSLFLIFTFESYEEISRTLQPALLSRVKESIEFTFVQAKSDVKEYIRECLQLRSKVDPNEVLSDKVTDAIADGLITNFRGRLSFRDINREMHRIFTTTYILVNQPSKYRIDSELYEKARKGPSAEEVVKRITERISRTGGQK